MNVEHFNTNILKKSSELKIMGDLISRFNLILNIYTLTRAISGICIDVLRNVNKI